MHLRSAQIRHYRSLAEVKVEFTTPITVIVGPNGAGKSNLVDCLRFVRDALVDGLEHAVTKREGMTRVRQCSLERPPTVSIRLEFSQDFDKTDFAPTSYEFSLKSIDNANYIVASEVGVFASAQKISKKNNAEIVIDYPKGTFTRDEAGKVSANGLNSRPIYPTVPTDELIFGRSTWWHLGMGGNVAHFMAAGSYSTIYPNTLRRASSADKGHDLTEDGANWASVLKGLLKTAEGKAALEKINEAMRAVIPSYKDVKVTTIGSYLVPNFSFEENGRGVEFDPPQLSDGTLHIFGLLLKMYQIPTPSLLIIEEPEQHVHPNVLSILAEAMREVSESTQIIVTTHSPHFVNQFKPEEIRVATMENGITNISTVKKSQIEAVKQRLMSLEEFMLAEGLHPEAE